MTSTTYEGTVVNGKIQLPADVQLPENARVLVTVPDALCDNTFAAHALCVPSKREISKMLAENDVQRSWVQSTADVCGGEPCARNTRHTVAGLRQWGRLGPADFQILQYHLELTQAGRDAA